jgi:alanine racemase
MPRPIVATIDPSAFAHNLSRIRAHAGSAKVWAVIKANAYGHGIERVFPALASADGLAMIDLQEVERCRSLGWRGPLALLEGVFEARDLDVCSRLDVVHTVHSDWQIDLLAAHKTHAAHHVMLKMNSGMNRLGFSPQRYRAAWTRLNALPQVAEITHITHFSDADGPRGIAHQLDVFNAAVQGLPGQRCISNSAASLRHESVASTAARMQSDWVRAGIALYGSAPDFPEHSAAHWGLQPTMTLASKLLAVQDLQMGDTVGYGSTFTAATPMRIGIVACGYADGYPRHAPSGTPILVEGLACTTVGRVSMDMIAVDLSAAPQAQPGSEVTLWGRASSGALLPIDEVAHRAGTIGYELMCALAGRVPVRVAAASDAI